MNPQSSIFGSNPQGKKQPLPPDDLPAHRLDDALSLLRFLRFFPIWWFVLGSQSARVVLDLERIGMVQLLRKNDGDIPMLKVTGVATR